MTTTRTTMARTKAVTRRHFTNIIGTIGHYRHQRSIAELATGQLLSTGTGKRAHKHDGG
jgi:hypothetical protein